MCEGVEGQYRWYACVCVRGVEGQYRCEGGRGSVQV